MPCVDLHCHSAASDGVLSPAELVQRAAANGVEILALTDHDTLAGLAAAKAEADALGICFVNGVEISVDWSATQIHVVGLAFDATAPRIVSALAHLSSGRIERAKRMAAELDKIGIHGCFEGAMRYAKNPRLISRSHFARYLVEIGVSKDIHSVFESYLAQGRPGYVTHQWASLSDAVSWITEAGGIAVIAHPGRYKVARRQLLKLFSEFKACGGQAIEVISGSHSADVTAHFGRLAREYDFMASCGSDFHSPTESFIGLGRLPPLPEGLQPVWEHFTVS